MFQVDDNLVKIEKVTTSFTFNLDDGETLIVNYVINATGNDINVTHDMEQVLLLSQSVNECFTQAETLYGIQFGNS